MISPWRVRVNLAESPLTRLKSHDLIDGTQFAAGEKLRRDFTRAQLSPRMGVDLSAPVVCGGARGAGARLVTGRSARVVLMLALDRLAAHYGMTVVAHRAPIRAWSAES
jgi:hypothetical protein